MSRSRRDLYVAALDVLLRSKMAAVARNRDWELLREVARLADEDAPKVMAVTDPALFQSWRAAVTRFHIAGWGSMTPHRVDDVQRRAAPVAAPEPRAPPSRPTP
jgi:hypothetical protein